MLTRMAAILLWLLCPPCHSRRMESSTQSGSSNIFVGLKFLALGKVKTMSAVKLNDGKWCVGDEDRIM